MLSTPAWFDMYSFDMPLTIPEPGEEDEAGINQSIASLDALLAGLVVRGVDPSRLVLGGFSQGAAMTLLAGLTTGTPLAGLFVLSERLPLRRKIKSVCVFNSFRAN
jgi:predicted esterase